MSNMNSCSNCEDEARHCLPQQQREWCLRAQMEILDLDQLVRIQGEILASLSREPDKTPEQLEIQCALSNELGKNTVKLYRLRGDLD